MSAFSRPGTPHEAGQDALTPGEVTPGEVTIEHMYYTFCPQCGALNDWSDRMPEARRRRVEHLEWHRRNAAVKAGEDKTDG